MSSDVTYCEMCGRPVRRREAKIVYVEGTRLVLCPSCFVKTSKRTLSTELREHAQQAQRAQSGKPPAARQALGKAGTGGSRIVEEFEVVPDFSERVRRARERLGWTQKVLAEAVKESENVIKRIESGRLVPSLELARRLENALKIQLLEPVADSSADLGKAGRKVDTNLTLGDMMVLRRKGEKE